MHCPLCVGLALLSVTRALAHVTLVVALWRRDGVTWGRALSAATSS